MTNSPKEKGEGLVEYALVLVLIAVVIVVIIGLLYDPIIDILNTYLNVK